MGINERRTDQFRYSRTIPNLLLLRKCKGFTNYDEIHNFERKLNLRQTTLENKLHNRAFDWQLYRDLIAIPQ